MTRVRTQPSVFAHLVGLVTLVVVGSAIFVSLAGDFQRRKPPEDRAGPWRAAVATLDRLGPEGARNQGLQTRTLPPPEAMPLPRMAGQLRRPPHEVVLADGTVWIRGRGPHAGWVAVDHDPRWKTPFTMRWMVWLVVAMGALLGAAWVARRLVAPLAALERAAPGWARGSVVNLPRAAPREIASLADALDQSQQDVARMNAERAMMLAGISHDLRTPLARLKFGVELVNAHPNDEQLKEGLNRDVDEIDAIVGQFIDFARDGRDEEETLVNLAAVVNEVLASDQGRWDMEIPPHAWVKGFPLALHRAVTNLVRNAQVHGQAPWAIRLRQPHPEGPWSLTIQNGGDCLTEAEKAKALQPFSRGVASGGSGLGLAIVNRVAAQHRARLLFEDASPSGVKVTLVFSARAL